MHLFEANFERIEWTGARSGNRVRGNLPLQLDATARQDLETILAEADGIGYVLSHGGDIFTQPATRLDSAALSRLESCANLHPALNRPIFQLARLGAVLRSDLPQILFCETAFFTDLPVQAKAYPLPYELFEKGCRRYGGDGLVHAWAWEQAARALPGLHKLVSVYLSGHPSLAAVVDGKAVEASQGFTPVEGLPGETTCGDIDPSIVLLLSENGHSPEEIEALLTQQSGYRALAESPFRLESLLNGDRPAGLAGSMLFHRLLESIGSMAASMGGMDALIFTGEQVEGSLPLIRRLCARMAFTGLQVSSRPHNHNKVLTVTEPGSPISVRVFEYDRSEALLQISV